MTNRWMTVIMTAGIAVSGGLIALGVQLGLVQQELRFILDIIN